MPNMSLTIVHGGMHTKKYNRIVPRGKNRDVSGRLIPENPLPVGHFRLLNGRRIAESIRGLRSKFNLTGRFPFVKHGIRTGSAAAAV